MKTFLNNIYPIKDVVLDEYISQWEPISCPKRTVLTSAGQTESFIYFVQEGIQKSYYLNEDKEHVMFFAYNPSFSGVMESFLTQTPSKYYLETITDSTFIRLPYSKHKTLLAEHRELETLFRKITESFLLGVIERHHQLMAFDIETRFRKFTQRSPHLLQMVSQKDIASYLRIDATNFSKLMNSVKI